MIGDDEEGEIIAALLGGFAGWFLQPWGTGLIVGGFVGLLVTGALTVAVNRVADGVFPVHTAAVMGVVVSLAVMAAPFPL